MSAVIKTLDAAATDVREAQRKLLKLQQELAPAAFHNGDHAVIDKTYLWDRLEKIDDHLHAALTKLGD